MKCLPIFSLLGVAVLLAGGCSRPALPPPVLQPSEPGRADDVAVSTRPAPALASAEPTDPRAAPAGGDGRSADPSRTPVAAPPDDAATGGSLVVARIGDAVVTREQLYQNLKAAHGFNMLMALVQYEMARSEARKAGVVITDEQLADEKARTLAKLFPQAKPEDYEGLIAQLIERENGTRTQFDLILATNANLRELAKPIVAGSVNEENLRARFNAIYGERVKVRHIQVDNLQEFAAARGRLDAGEDFAKVAQEMSTNRASAPRGGELKPFARHTPGLPTAFVDAAFTLEVGQLSEPVQADGAYHLLKLEEKIEPKIVKYEDVRESVKQDMVEELLDETVKFLRNQFGEAARQSLQVEDPALKAEFDARLREREATVRDREQLRQRLDQERQDAAAATQPAETPAAPNSQP